MTTLDTARKAIHEELALTKMAIEECEEKLKAVEQVKLDLSKHRNNVVKLEAALRAIDGPGAVTKSREDKLAKPRKIADRVAMGKLGLPPTGLDFFESCLSYIPMSANDLVPVVMAKMELHEFTDDQEKSVRARLHNALSQLVKLERAKSEGTMGSMKYRLP